MNIEGLGRQLDPELDIWSVAKPELDAILKEKQSLRHVSKELRDRLSEWLSQAPDLPGLVHDYLVKANSGQLGSYPMQATPRTTHHKTASQRNVARAIAGGSLSISGAILIAMETGPWFLSGYSVAGLVVLLIGVWQLLKALR